jgi:SWI/SNF-related matrix-associated actin-dependent regulator 1 of chromatin subfamily A
VLTDDNDGNCSMSSESPSGGNTLPHLVIAPASVLSNWKREFEKFAPHLNVVKYHGSKKEREQLQEELRVHLPRKVPQGKRRFVDPPDVILAPITYFQLEKSDDRSFLRKFRYGYLVVDEAHLLKNARGTRYKTLDKFSTEHRLLLTGTPVQNNAKELLSLLCFLMPLFSRKSMADSYDNESLNDGGESMLQHFVSLEGDVDTTGEATYRKLKQLFSPFVLRRRKLDVLSQVMQPKTQKVEFVEIEPAARQLYDSLIFNQVKAKKMGDDTSRDHLFTQLRKASHHPLLLRARHLSKPERAHLTEAFYKYGAFRGEGCTKAKVEEELKKFNDFQIHLSKFCEFANLNKPLIELQPLTALSYISQRHWT